MRIILVSLPSPFAEEPAMGPPLGLCYISAFLKEHGFDDICGVDFGIHKSYDYYNSKKFLERVPLDGDCYGIYCMTCQFTWLVDAVQYIKRKNPNSWIIVGGPHASTCPEDCIAIAGADIAVRGDGEHAILAILKGKPFSEIGGICYLRNDKRIIYNGMLRRESFDELPFPDRNLFGLDKYHRSIDGDKAAHIVTLKGCPFKCAFCDKTSVGSRVRYRLVDDVMEEIDTVTERYSIKSFVIYDDIFTLKHSRVRTFCSEFRKCGIKWRCWARADTITYGLLSTMKRSGLTSITMGIESGDDGVLSRINKGVTAAQNREALLLCKKVGVPVRCSLMYGNPGETRKSVERTIELVKETQPDEWNLAVLTPTPGSDIWDNPGRYGISFDKEWVREQNYVPCNRFGTSGVGDIWIGLDTMSRRESLLNLRYFIEELERACPRKKIQDTIQNINVERLRLAG